ncbi:hypothetical protein GQ43DRAFT_455567 [Delitschia confertaspora ATCC 74209]|uniref:SAC domain-containing protein n=1 Tax=Delitschia confertaspora ATCC 74209 TaxID=1513339 RepID=A0A9P4MW39_9PLEO|nr:hypothetical protein GQ43DRAFT_455567 [Delitschia confertaspora ATCC 74209]
MSGPLQALRNTRESLESPSTDDAPTHLTPPSESDPDNDSGIDRDDHGRENHRMRNLSSVYAVNRGSREHYDGEDSKSDEDENFRPAPGRDSIDSIANYELYTPEEDRAVRRKLDRRLVLFMAMLYCLSFLDRSNIGNARIAGLEKDLKLSSKQYEWLLWAFYITYIAFEWMTLMYRIVPPHIYISICILSWGIIASLQSLTTSFGSLLALRALLGVGEAAFGPGVPFYLSFFFRRHELAFRTGLFISASPLSSSFAGVLAWAITKLAEHVPLAPWRLLFILEGFPSVLVAVWAWDAIPDGPGTAKFLNSRLQEVAILRLRQQKEETDDEYEELGKGGLRRARRSKVKIREVLQTLLDPKCYLTALMFFSCNVAFSSMPVFLPTIIRDMGHTSLDAQALSAPPYLFASAVVILTAYLSDRYQTRSTFIMLHSLLATFGYLTIAVVGHYRWQNNTIRYLGLYPAIAGFFSAITVIITWTINNQESDAAKGTGMAVLNIIGQMGPLVGTSIFPKKDAPYYVRGMVVCAVFMAVVGILAYFLRLVLIYQNKGKNGVDGETDAAKLLFQMDLPKSNPEMAELANLLPGPTKAADSPDSIAKEGSTDVSEMSSAVGSPLTAISSEAPLIELKPDAVGDLEKEQGSTRDTESLKLDGDEEDPAIPTSFQRFASPAATRKDKAYEKVGEEGINRMHKFTLYETSTRFYLIGSDTLDKHYRVLKIDRTAPPGHLNIFEDDIVYDRREMNQLLNAIDDGNKGSGGMKQKCSAWGLLGFIRFTEAYYMLLITKRAQVAMIGGHYIYQVDGTELIPLTTGSTSRFQKDRNPEEARFLSILNTLDLKTGFYFSYSYNITRCLQQNIIREREALNEGIKTASFYDVNDMFVWNNYLLEPARVALKSPYDWCRPIIHGYIDQSSMDVFGRRVFITIIARRSRFFAGARFLKRGANDLGYVANDVETEQIVSEGNTTSFHAPGPRLYASPTYTSYVQHRGSIPLYWTQDNTGVTPKPDIDLNLVDPFFSAAALHFDNLFQRYGAPVYVLNLIKSRERTPRESKLLHEYQNAINYLNQALPADKKIIYEAFDMARAAKTRGQDVIGTLENIAEKVLQTTDFFHNGDHSLDDPKIQNGVARTNCIDCLDRTNACQFVVGKRALGRQLQALGVIEGNTVEYDTDCVNMFTQMFHGHGDAIAIQYGGSHLVNTMSTYRKINHWQNSSRDMVESFKRYYHNSFLDSQRQEAYNLFLGNYIFAQGRPMLWDLPTDYYLHHEDPRQWLTRGRRDYINWYTPAYLEERKLPGSTLVPLGSRGVGEYDDYWLEYYRPLSVSSFRKIFAFKLISPIRPFAEKTVPSRDINMSPFIVRKSPNEQESPEKPDKKQSRKGVTILDPSDPHRHGLLARHKKEHHLSVPSSGRISPVKSSILRDPHFETQTPSSTSASINASQSLGASMSTSRGDQKNFIPADKTQMTQWTLTQFYENSLHPSVTLAEEDEYSRYVEHPLNLPLVVGTETPSPDDPVAMDFIEYLSMANVMDNYIDTASVRPSATYMRSSTVADNVPIRPSISAHTTVSKPELYAATISSSHSSDITGLHIPTGTGRFHHIPEEDIEEYRQYLGMRGKENVLDVLGEDFRMKRYKAYRQWLKGKSFFKQGRGDLEFGYRGHV